MTLFHKGECSRLPVQHKKMTFDQASVCVQLYCQGFIFTVNVAWFQLLVDDLLVYNGTVQAVKAGARGILPTCQGPQQYHTILFTDNPDIVKREKHTVIK